jgi:hypothetical protein
MELSTADAIVDRFADLSQDRANLRRYRSGINTLFTPEALALRARSGMGRNNHRYNIEGAAPDARLNGEVHQLSLDTTETVESIEGGLTKSPAVGSLPDERH